MNPLNPLNPLNPATDLTIASILLVLAAAAAAVLAIAGRGSRSSSPPTITHANRRAEARKLFNHFTAIQFKGSRAAGAPDPIGQSD